MGTEPPAEVIACNQKENLSIQKKISPKKILSTQKKTKAEKAKISLSESENPNVDIVSDKNNITEPPAEVIACNQKENLSIQKKNSPKKILSTQKKTKAEKAKISLPESENPNINIVSDKNNIREPPAEVIACNQKKKRKDSVPQSVFEQSKINSDVEKNDISQIVKSQKKIQSILNQTNFEYGNARQPARK